jgi:T4 bacteriophage base plate protein
MLPRIQHPLFDVKIPSTKTKTKFRPMTVREEKILLIAKESEDDSDIFTAIKQIVNNCLVDEKINIDNLAIFDIEYIYLKIRAFSIDNMIHLAFRDNADKEIYEFDIDLNTVEVEFPEGVDKKIMINESSGLIMKYPPSSLYGDKAFFNEVDDTKKMDHLIANCIDKVFDADKIYLSSDVTEKEMIEFIDDLPITTFNKINEFVLRVPSINHEITYTNKEGTEVKIALRTLNDFFTLR